MNELLNRCWWTIALYGVLAIAFGVLALVWPGLTLLVLVALFAVWALFGGAAALYGAVRHRERDKGWWLLLLLGLVSLAAGAIAIFNPGITLLALVLVIGAYALITGVLEIVMAIRLRKTMEREWLLALAGALSVVFGLMVFLFPAAGALAMVLVVSVYAVVIGALLLVLAFRARRWQTGAGAKPDVGVEDRAARPV